MMGDEEAPAHGGAGGVAGGEDADAEALALAGAEPAVDMSKHKSGIIPILQCEPLGHAALCALCPTGGRSQQRSPVAATHRNLVATVNLDCKLDLKTITLHARNAEYNPKARRSGAAAHRALSGVEAPARASGALTRLPPRAPLARSASRRSSCASETPRRRR
jgi:hypothetical protein